MRARERPAEVVRAGQLELRRYRPADAPALHAAIADSIEHLRPWMPWVAAEPLTLGERRDLITSTFDRGWDERTDFVYGMFEAGEVVGGCGLHARIADDGLEIGYWVRFGSTRRGLATAAAGALAEAAFALDHIGHLEIHHDAANVASARVPARLGFVLVGERADAREAPGETGRSCVWRLERPPARS